MIKMYVTAFILGAYVTVGAGIYQAAITDCSARSGELRYVEEPFRCVEPWVSVFKPATEVGTEVAVFVRLV